jgi:alpha-amylase
VIIDWVANHTGWDHVWTKTHPDWYEQDPVTGTFKRASGMDDIIELDYTNREMRGAMTEAMKFWVRECGIDGFRCDLASWVEVDFWLEAIPEVNRLKPLFWLAEADALDVPEYMQVFDAAYTWTWMHRSADWYRHHQPLSALKDVLLRYDSAPGIPAWFTSNHDENTWNGTEYEKYGDAALALAVHSITWKGLPLVYNGQEQPNRKRLEFFEKDPIDWNGEPLLHGFYRKLLRLHLDHPALDARADLFRLPTSADANVLAYLRKSGDAEVVVLLNLSAHHVRFDLKGNFPQGRFVDMFTNEVRDLERDRHFTFAPWQYSVLTQYEKERGSK